MEGKIAVTCSALYQFKYEIQTSMSKTLIQVNTRIDRQQGSRETQSFHSAQLQVTLSMQSEYILPATWLHQMLERKETSHVNFTSYMPDF